MSVIAVTYLIISKSHHAIICCIYERENSLMEFLILLRFIAKIFFYESNKILTWTSTRIQFSSIDTYEKRMLLCIRSIRSKRPLHRNRHRTWPAISFAHNNCQCNFSQFYQMFSYRKVEKNTTFKSYFRTIWVYY